MGRDSREDGPDDSSTRLKVPAVPAFDDRWPRAPTKGASATGRVPDAKPPFLEYAQHHEREVTMAVVPSWPSLRSRSAFRTYRNWKESSETIGAAAGAVDAPRCRAPLRKRRGSNVAQSAALRPNAALRLALLPVARYVRTPTRGGSDGHEGDDRHRHLALVVLSVLEETAA